MIMKYDNDDDRINVCHCIFLYTWVSLVPGKLTYLPVLPIQFLQSLAGSHGVAFGGGSINMLSVWMPRHAKYNMLDIGCE